MISLTIDIDPVAQGRPRVVVKGQFPHFYDPQKSKAYKRQIQFHVRNHMIVTGSRQLEGPVAVKLSFVMRKPASVPKNQVFHVKKPDLDNLVKAVLDGIQGPGLIIADDKAIVSVLAHKVYAGPGEVPSVKIQVVSADSGKDSGG